MSPPISKDWWLAAALTGAAVPAAVGQPASGTDGTPAGVITTYEQGKPATAQPLYLPAARGQRVVTGPNQTVHVLFPDQSAVTVGPNSEIAIADLRYDAQKKDGNILIDMTKGLLRVVGGFISKRSELQVRTSTATVGIRGGITIVQTDGNGTTGSFLFGEQMQITGQGGGGTTTIHRPGFSSSVGGGNNNPSPPQPFNSGQLLGGLGAGMGGGSGGGFGGGTLPPANQPPGSGYAPDRLPTNRDTGPEPNQTNNNAPPTLNQVLGGQPSPGNQS